jgi:hypothetical protein
MTISAYSSPSVVSRLARQRLEAKRQAKHAPDVWRDWLTLLFPSYISAGFAPRHEAFWQWVWAIRRGARPLPFVAIWPRGGGKSVSAEIAAVAIGARDVRDYVWYCCETQPQADKHVETIGDMLESPTFGVYYPDMGQPEVGKYGNPKAWRRSRLWTRAGFTIDAIGLDTAARGARVKENRPGLIVLDDVDAKHDSPGTMEKKIEIITTSLLPAGSNDCAVLFVQNLMTPDSVASRLVDGRADFLLDRMVSGPFPAIEGLTHHQNEHGQFVITGGAATWDGQNLETCQEQINTWGLSAFLQEAQHEVDAPPGGMFDHLVYQHCTWAEMPDLVRIVVWVDPAVTATDQSDSMGIQADGVAATGKIYRLWSWEAVTSPEDALSRAILKAVELGAESVGVETDQGGDLWRSTYERAWQTLADAGRVAGRKPAFKEAKAGAGHGSKAHRAGLMLADYERGNIVHVAGTHVTLERALNRFPKTKPFDLVDAGYWAWRDLQRPAKAKVVTIDYEQ